MACKYFHCANSITVGTDDVTIGFSESVTLTDKNRICFKIKDSIPSTASTLPVVISVNSTTVPLWNKYGNPVIASELKSNRVYKCYYGATTPHVIIQNLPLTEGCL